MKSSCRRIGKTSACGAAISPDHGKDGFHLLQSARIAGLVAGRADSGSLLFEPSMERSAPNVALLERDLRTAFSGGPELELWLQPKVHLASAECRSAEALLRWRNSGGDFVPPPVVIGLIDRLGLRHRFNRWLFQQAAQILHQLRMDGLENDVSINLTATDLYEAEVPDLIGQADGYKEGKRLIETNDIPSLRQVIDFSGDSTGNFSGASIEESRAEVLAAGIVINGLPILDEGPDDPLLQEYQERIIGGPGAFAIPALGRQDFVTALRRKLILEIAGQMPDQITPVSAP